MPMDYMVVENGSDFPSAIGTLCRQYIDRYLYISMPPSKKRGHIDLHMSIARSVDRYVRL